MKGSDVNSEKSKILRSEQSLKDMPSGNIHDTSNPNSPGGRKMKAPQEEKTARELARDYVLFKLGKQSLSNSKGATILRRLGKEIEIRHEPLLKNMCEKLDINESSAERTFQQVADEIFSNGINWGRIVVLYTFAGKIALFSTQHDLQLTEDIIRWTGDYVASLSEWIIKAGGWVSKDFFVVYEGRYLVTGT